MDGFRRFYCRTSGWGEIEMKQLTKKQKELMLELKNYGPLSVTNKSPDFVKRFKILEEKGYAKLVSGGSAQVPWYQYVGPELRRNMSQFEDYLSEKYDYIGKFDMCKDEREARQDHHLTLSEAIYVWNKLYA